MPRRHAPVFITHVLPLLTHSSPRHRMYTALLGGAPSAAAAPSMTSVLLTTLPSP